jgi:hypothetical protein
MRCVAVCAAACLALASAVAHGADDVSTGGHVESDLYTNDQSPPAALLDGNTQTHFAQHRLQDSDWRLWLKQSAKLQTVSFVQGWQDWSQALQVRLEVADGSSVDLALKPGTREPQTFDLNFLNPTAFVDVTVLQALPGKDDNGWGGFAEMQLLGTAVSSDAAGPAVSNIQVQRDNDTSATIRWTTDKPATSQLRFSCETIAAQSTPPLLDLITDHSVQIQSSSPLRGQIEIRSADGTGNRAEVRHDAFVTIDTTWQYGAGGWSFHLGDSWVPAAKVYGDDGVKHGFTQAWIGGDGWTQWMKAEEVAKVKNAGLTPELIHYFFGDPKLEDVQARKDAFLADITTLAQMLVASGVGDQTIVTLEPEYNQGEVAKWDGWNDLMIQAMTILRSQAGAKVGLLPGDWDIDHLVPISMGRAAAFADFVAFQEMRASTRDPADDAYQVVNHAVRFSHYLSRKFLRPVRLGYLMVSDYDGWSYVQRDVVVEMCERQQELRNAGLVAISWMDYLDSQASGGYFNEGESHKGLKYSNNVAKPAWEVWKECSLHGPSWVGSGHDAPGAPPPAEPASSGCSCRLQTERPSAGVWEMSVVGALAALRLRRRRTTSC